MKRDSKKAYAAPLLDKRAKLAEVSEGTPPVVPISGVLLNGN